MKAARIDTTQPAIVDGLRARGYKVQSLAKVGRGCPDLLILTPAGNWRVLEVKSPGGRLKPDQVTWRAAWGAEHAPIVYTLGEALTALGKW